VGRAGCFERNISETQFFAWTTDPRTLDREVKRAVLEKNKVITARSLEDETRNALGGGDFEV
jgi:hypothetical protein